jgi:hypothetical protein
MKNYGVFLIVGLCALSAAHAQVPGILNYQGRVSVAGTNFTGTGQFAFALVDGGNDVSAQATAFADSFDGLQGIASITVANPGAGYTSVPNVAITDSTGTGAVAIAEIDGGSVTGIAVTVAGADYAGPTITIDPPPADLVTNTLWSNDGTSAGGSQTVAAVSLPVTKGLYSVLLGDTTIANMTVAVPASVFANNNVSLRVWFNDGVHGFQQLLPDQRIGAAGYALVAGGVPAGAITSAQLSPNLFVTGSFGSENLNLPATTCNSCGVLFLGGTPFLQAYGSGNTFVGANAGNFTMTGTANTADGASALAANTTGFYNTANGASALAANTTGSENTANGVAALGNNTTGNRNTANGADALNANTTGDNNTANGRHALSSNTTGGNNTANGQGALGNNTTGDGNGANGFAALSSNTTGSRNTANGADALGFNTTGLQNTADGGEALGNNTTGANNIALGYLAGQNLTTGGYNIDIGSPGVAAEANTIRIGVQGTQTKTFIAGISGATASGGVAVFVNSSGQLGTVTSSKRFKQDIRIMNDASDVLLSLHPVTFRYKPDIDPAGIPQFGLVAEEVDKVAPELVARGADGKPYSVRYEQVNAMLLNEFLKEHHRVEDLEKRLADLESKLNKVGEQVEQSKAAPVAANVRNQGGM